MTNRLHHGLASAHVDDLLRAAAEQRGAPAKGPRPGRLAAALAHRSRGTVYAPLQAAIRPAPHH